MKKNPQPREHVPQQNGHPQSPATLGALRDEERALAELETQALAEFETQARDHDTQRDRSKAEAENCRRSVADLDAKLAALSAERDRELAAAQAHDTEAASQHNAGLVLWQSASERRRIIEALVPPAPHPPTLPDSQTPVHTAAVEALKAAGAQNPAVRPYPGQADQPVANGTTETAPYPAQPANGAPPSRGR